MKTGIFLLAVIFLFSCKKETINTNNSLWTFKDATYKGKMIFVLSDSTHNYSFIYAYNDTGYNALVKFIGDPHSGDYMVVSPYTLYTTKDSTKCSIDFSNGNTYIDPYPNDESNFASQDGRNEHVLISIENNKIKATFINITLMNNLQDSGIASANIQQ